MQNNSNYPCVFDLHNAQRLPACSFSWHRIGVGVLKNVGFLTKKAMLYCVPAAFLVGEGGYGHFFIPAADAKAREGY